ncbi:M14 family metallopeptidase [candidate division KSB1 bacterium]
MNKLSITLACLFVIAQSLAQTPDWQTYYEKLGFLETSRYAETIAYCKKLAESSPWIHYTSFGMSQQGRELPLLIADKNEDFNSTSVRSGDHIVLLVEACIHPGESEGKDAGMMLLRDIAIHKKYENLLDHATILFIPIFNVDGHERFGPFNRINQNGPKEMGWRVTATNLNLNRDFLKADAREMKAWLRLYSEWLPDFFIDIHTTDGADYQYPLTYAMEFHDNMYYEIGDWQKNVFIEYVECEMEKAGFPIFPYIAFRNWFDPRSGIRGGVSPPMISQGYTALHNRPGLLVETHMLKDYKTRVTATYEILKQTLEILNTDYEKLNQLVKKADIFTASEEFRNNPFPVKFSLSDKDSTMLDFKGFEYEVVESDLSGGNWFQYSDKPAIFSIPYFNTPIPEVTVDLPEAYIIPVEWEEVIQRLRLHGIHFNQLKKSTAIKVKTYKFKDYKWNNDPYEGRFRMQFEYDIIEDEKIFPAGSAVIPMNQRAAKLIIYILEPKAEGSYVSWGFFNTIFERKEYVESYVMEEMAREMLAEDPELLEEFELKKMEDPEFAGNFWSILLWFYSKTPYWDERKDVYPVGKIFDRKVLDSLELE